MPVVTLDVTACAKLCVRSSVCIKLYLLHSQYVPHIDHCINQHTHVYTTDQPFPIAVTFLVTLNSDLTNMYEINCTGVRKLYKTCCMYPKTNMDSKTFN